MTDQCQYLEYRPLSTADESDDADDTGDADDTSGIDDTHDTGNTEPRAYCTAADRFVQAMRADICNLRYGLDPETDCEFYRDAEGLPEGVENEGAGGN